jgi:hypothetical protein
MVSLMTPHYLCADLITGWQADMRGGPFWRACAVHTDPTFPAMLKIEMPAGEAWALYKPRTLPLDFHPAAKAAAEARGVRVRPGVRWDAETFEYTRIMERNAA